VEEVAVRLWVERFVVGINLCPFARPFVMGSAGANIRYVLVNSHGATALHAAALDETSRAGQPSGGRTKNPSIKTQHRVAVRRCAGKILAEAEELANGTSPHSTTLNIVPEFTNFDAFLDLAEVIESLIESKDLRDSVQVATFHPRYCFADASDARDVGNWTNRSPFPVIHLIRSEDVSKGIEEFNGKTDLIWRRNVKAMERIGVDKLREMMDALMRDARAEALAKSKTDLSSE
jgi:hypothetical protein